MNPNQDSQYKMKIISGPMPTDEEMEDLFAEAASLQMALEEADDDDIEIHELEAAYHSVIKKIRLNYLRMGRQPMDVMTDL